VGNYTPPREFAATGSARQYKKDYAELTVWRMSVTAVDLNYFTGLHYKNDVHRLVLSRMKISGGAHDRIHDIKDLYRHNLWLAPVLVAGIRQVVLFEPVWIDYRFRYTDHLLGSLSYILPWCREKPRA
jgi:hypothetical protein